MSSQAQVIQQKVENFLGQVRGQVLDAYSVLTFVRSAH